MRNSSHAVVPCTTMRQRGDVVDAVGHVERGRRVGDRPLGVSAAADEGDDPPPVRGPADHLAAGDQRQGGLGQVGVLRVVGVGVVHAGPVDLDQQLPGPGAGSGRSTSVRTSGPPNSVIRIARMPTTFGSQGPLLNS